MSQWVNDSAFVRSVRGPDGANPVKNISGQDVLLGVNEPATSSFTLTAAPTARRALEQPQDHRLRPVRHHARRRVLLPAEHQRAARHQRVSGRPRWPGVRRHGRR